MGTRFMHTSDWQLGVTRHFLSMESQARWSEARFEAVRRLGRIAKEERSTNNPANAKKNSPMKREKSSTSSNHIFFGV